MLESAGVPRVSEPLAELCEITRRWTSAIRWSLEPDGDTGEVALNLAVDDRNRHALYQLHDSMDGLWNSDDLSRDDILVLLRAYRDAGLGDEKPGSSKAPGMSALFVERLREVRDEVAALGRQL